MRGKGRGITLQTKSPFILFETCIKQTEELLNLFCFDKYWSFIAQNFLLINLINYSSDVLKSFDDVKRRSRVFEFFNETKLLTFFKTE